MKLLTLILLGLTITAQAELILNEPNKPIENKSDEIKNFIGIIDSNEKFSTYFELITTNTMDFSLFVKPSPESVIYSLKISKEGKVYFNSNFASGLGTIEHKIKLQSGHGKYLIEYIETNTQTIPATTILKKIYTITFEGIENAKKHIKSSGWVQSKHPKIKNLAAEIVRDAQGEFDTAIAIDDWITKNIVYNYTSTSKSQKIDALTTLDKRMGVCTGYSNLFAALARASGLEVKVMTGKARFGGKKYYHQWNEVKINGTWYFIDTTWNAGRGRRDYFTNANQYPETHYRAKEVKSY